MYEDDSEDVKQQAEAMRIKAFDEAVEKSIRDSKRESEEAAARQEAQRLKAFYEAVDSANRRREQDLDNDQQYETEERESSADESHELSAASSWVQKEDPPVDVDELLEPVGRLRVPSVPSSDSEEESVTSVGSDLSMNKSFLLPKKKGNSQKSPKKMKAINSVSSILSDLTMISRNNSGINQQNGESTKIYFGHSFSLEDISSASESLEDDMNEAGGISSGEEEDSVDDFVNKKWSTTSSR